MEGKKYIDKKAKLLNLCYKETTNRIFKKDLIDISKSELR
jgi:hypothetical protein